MRRIRFIDWLARDAEAKRRVDRVRAAFGEYRRERPRDREKARLLRKRGNPQRLIGPERELGRRNAPRKIGHGCRLTGERLSWLLEGAILRGGTCISPSRSSVRASTPAPGAIVPRRPGGRLASPREPRLPQRAL